MFSIRDSNHVFSIRSSNLVKKVPHMRVKRCVKNMYACQHPVCMSTFCIPVDMMLCAKIQSTKKKLKT